ncbi:MAG: flagellar protein FliT [Azoarcus sp.]|jgi:flagellar protein FliT|nr:flagellar protein FliT [Azoarcus sp.]
MDTSGLGRNRQILRLKEAEALVALYEAMTEAARAHDWDRLTGLEQRTAAIRAAALARPPAPVTEDMDKLSELLTRILRLDREVRSHVEPARAQARQQLAIEVKGRSVRAAYGEVGDIGERGGADG